MIIKLGYNMLLNTVPVKIMLCIHINKSISVTSAVLDGQLVMSVRSVGIEVDWAGADKLSRPH